MRLWIAEKPSLGKAIAAHLGKVKTGDRSSIEIDGGREMVTWCVGHIFEQVEPDHYLPAPTPDMLNKSGRRRWVKSDLPIIPKKWCLRTTNKSQYAVIKGLLSKAKEIVVAGDPDREGQLLVDEVLLEAGVDPEAPNVKRIWLSALDDASILKALANLKPNADYRAFRESALARSRADWLIGMNGTRAYTLSSGGLVTVGRVQTPTLAMVVRRDMQIANFKPIDYFVPYVEMADGTRLEWVGSVEGARTGIDPEGRIISRELAEKIIADIRAGMEWAVSLATSNEVKESPPLPHSLDSLQMQLNGTHKMSAQKVLDLAQSLYETHKLTTYPRSDCRYLPGSMFEERDRILDGIHTVYSKEIDGGDARIKTSCWDDKKVTAHHAIIPTGQVPRSGLTVDERVAFDAISKQYIAQFYPDAVFKKSELEILFGGLDRFRVSEKALLKPGWKSLLGSEIAGEEGKTLRPGMKKGMEIKGC